METTNATYTSPDWRYYKYPSSVSPISTEQHRGIIVLCTITLVSCITTLSLAIYLSYHFYTGRKDRGTPLHKNQYMLLIHSLVLADFQLDLGFLLDVEWLHRGQILAPSAGCSAQGWLINFGDLGSGLFVLAIAFHTFLTVVYGLKILHRTICWVIVSLWLVSAVLTAIPLALHPTDIYVAQGSWVRVSKTSVSNIRPQFPSCFKCSLLTFLKQCSVNAKYNIFRLMFHYLWDFIAQFGVIVMYATTFIVVRRRMGDILPDLAHSRAGRVENGVMDESRRSSKTRKVKVSRATMYMVLYPLIYVLSTLPLSAGRLSTFSGLDPSIAYLFVAGCLMASGGWMNFVVYSFTRGIFQAGKRRKSTDRQYPLRTPSGSGLESSQRSGGKAIEMSPPGNHNSTLFADRLSSGGSTQNVIAIGKRTNHTSPSDPHEGVTMERSWEVRTEEVLPKAKLPESYVLGHPASVSS